jgi:sulfite exporter TauE/SafE
MGIPEIISSAFLMGAVGSIHCIGMCGPLAFALPIGHRNNWGRAAGGTLYNAGRIVTYTALGLFLGATSQYVISVRWQGVFSVLLGTLILVYLLLPAARKVVGSGTKTASGPFLYLRHSLGKLMQSKKYSSLFSFGLLNGLLPCGMVYLAITVSFLTGSILKGGLFMFSFGMGTFPAMLGVVFFGSFLNQQLRMRLRRLTPVFLALMAALLILRGLGLGIPYLSPDLPGFVVQGSDVICH